MVNYPKTLLDFEKRFATEEACRDYLCPLRWPEGIYCPRCSHKRVQVKNRNMYQCCQCQYEFSVTAGSGYLARKEERYFATLELNTIYSRIGSQAYNHIKEYKR